MSSVFKLTLKIPIKYRKSTDISVVTDTILIYGKKRYLKCRYDTDISISAIYRRYFWHIYPPLVQTSSRYQLPPIIISADLSFLYPVSLRTVVMSSVLISYCILFCKWEISDAC